MAEKAHHFQDLRAEELITSSPGPSAHTVSYTHLTLPTNREV